MDPSPRFVFRHEWCVPQAPAAVTEVLLDLGDYPRWWPQVRAVVRLGEDDAWVRCRSRLPYTLDLRLHAVSRQPPLLETSVSGDLNGWVRWRVTPEREGTRLGFEQEVDLTSAWIARVARPLEPLLRWNHSAMMEGCRRGLTARLGGAD